MAGTAPAQHMERTTDSHRRTMEPPKVRMIRKAHVEKNARKDHPTIAPVGLGMGEGRGVGEVVGLINVPRLVRVAEGVAVGEREGVGVWESKVGDWEGEESVGVGEGVWVDEESVGVGEGVWEGDKDSEDVAEGVAVIVGDGLGVWAVER